MENMIGMLGLSNIKFTTIAAMLVVALIKYCVAGKHLSKFCSRYREK